ncbi:hypothetical protein B0H17DRAFT_1126872 [Mycena rosella]|uniref:Uncharacterized protein n=1 Tax=Mycena rosella TaxID=1033263 RepID=A0AAD7GT07_MYCRO|nr:hypothetical protein B0H17DRAFT_1126872 [Mycena rosella]
MVQSLCRLVGYQRKEWDSVSVGFAQCSLSAKQRINSGTRCQKWGSEITASNIVDRMPVDKKQPAPCSGPRSKRHAAGPAASKKPHTMGPRTGKASASEWAPLSATKFFYFPEWFVFVKGGVHVEFIPKIYELGVVLKLFGRGSQAAVLSESGDALTLQMRTGNRVRVSFQMGFGTPDGMRTGNRVRVLVQMGISTPDGVLRMVRNGLQYPNLV